MYTLQYDTVISSQYEDIERRNRRTHLLQSIFPRQLLLRKFSSRIKIFWLSQSFKSKGLLSKLQEKKDEMKGKDLSHLIATNAKMIGILIEIKEEFANFDEGSYKKFPDLYIAKCAIDDTLLELYAIERACKKANFKVAAETSDIAISSAEVSHHTLETVINGD